MNYHFFGSLANYKDDDIYSRTIISMGLAFVSDSILSPRAPLIKDGHYVIRKFFSIFENVCHRTDRPAGGMVQGTSDWSV